MAKKMKLKKVFETNNLSELIEIRKILSDKHIRFETKAKSSTIIKDFINLFFYQVLTSGIDRRNEVTCVFVEEKDLDHVEQIIRDMKLPIQ